jgi:hypothetical protein
MDTIELEAQVELRNSGEGSSKHNIEHLIPD